MMAGKLPDGWDSDVPRFDPEDPTALSVQYTGWGPTRWNTTSMWRAGD